jgi:DNA-binding beta-propeller fold protein YncE
VANTVNKIDLQTLEVVDKYAVPGGPDCMDISADGKLLLVTARWAKKLTVVEIASRKIVQQINVGRSPHGVWTLDHAARH